MPLEDWSGVERDTEPTAPGLQTSQNTRYYTDGELRRRRALAPRCTTESGSAVAPFFMPGVGFFLLIAKSTGTVEAVSV